MAAGQVALAAASRAVNTAANTASYKTCLRYPRDSGAWHAEYDHDARRKSVIGMLNAYVVAAEVRTTQCQ